MPTKDQALTEIARCLKAIETQQSKQTRILETLNHNLVQLFRRPSDIVEQAPTERPPIRNSTFGWVKAAEMQRDGLLRIGDVKLEQDDSVWVWTGETWERVEMPSDNNG